MLYGAVAGVLIAFGSLAFFGAYFAVETVEAVPVSAANTAVDTVFKASTRGFFLLVGFVVVLGGMAVAMFTYAIGRTLDPDTNRFALAYMIPVGMLVGGALGFATISLGITIAGQTSIDGGITVSVTSLTYIAITAGIVAGGATAPLVDLLARPATIGPRNEATPVSSKAFWSDLMGAIGVPMLAIVVVAIIAISLSQVLLNSHSTAVAVTIFAITGAVILGVTTLLALRPWDRSTPQS